MSDKKFYLALITIIIIGTITSACLVGYTMNLRKNISITSYIVSED